MLGDDKRFLLDLFQWMCTIGLGVLVWLRKPGQDASNAVQALRESHSSQISDHANRLSQIEAHMAHMPDEGEFRKLEGQVNQVAEQLSGIEKSLNPIRVSVQRIEDFLLRSRLP